MRVPSWSLIVFEAKSWFVWNVLTFPLWWCMKRLSTYKYVCASIGVYVATDCTPETYDNYRDVWEIYLKKYESLKAAGKELVQEKVT